MGASENMIYASVGMRSLFVSGHAFIHTHLYDKDEQSSRSILARVIHKPYLSPTLPRAFFFPFHLDFPFPLLVLNSISLLSSFAHNNYHL